LSVDNKVAIVGMACRFPDAASADELWNNVLAQRRAFRTFPPERLNLESYGSDDPSAVDSTYVRCGAFLENYEFDRVKFRISGETYRSADLVHWLALDVANTALADAGFADGSGLPKQTTGVFLGNTLTGEFSRAAVLRQRWPYVQRVLAKVLGEEQWDSAAVSDFLAKIEPEYKRPFPAPGAESLVGGLANTIAGRICNYFDVKGGGYIVDGACSSSLLAVIQACSALMAGDVDVALAGGVDLSMDPFELVGFARTGAIAKDAMRVFDRRATGFLPGEGCGFVVLTRYDEALAARRRIYSAIRGWGISSDGAGGMTRPEVNGQRLALQRAYQRAGCSIGDVAYFEAHGTGTEVGDLVELQTLTAERQASAAAQPAVIGSIKANIGHTKAAAGIAGLIKATMAVCHGVLPPTTGCEAPHPEICAPDAALCVTDAPTLWPGGGPRRAGVSSFGFGGINAHVVLEQSQRSRPPSSLGRFFTPDCELFLFNGDTSAELLARVKQVLDRAPALSLAELTDLAATLQQDIVRQVRAAVIASTPTELRAHLEKLARLLQEGKEQYADASNSIFIGRSAENREVRIGYLFPGQAAPIRRDAGALGSHFPSCRRIYDAFSVPEGSDGDTAVAQPAIVAASLAGVAALDELGLRADFALGHSVGEIAALCWAGALSRDTALKVAIERGRAMAAAPGGSMAGVAASFDDVVNLCRATDVEIAGFNSPRQIVISGPSEHVDRAVQEARARGWHATILPVSRAFHSRMMTEASVKLRDCLSRQEIGRVEQRVFSSVTGDVLSRGTDLRDLLVRQVTRPVEFQKALERAVASGVDLLIEVGPGSILTGLARDSVPVPVISIDAGSKCHRGLFSAAAAMFVMGAPLRTSKLFERYAKPFDLAQPKTFLANPCETIAPLRRADPKHAPPPHVAATGASRPAEADPIDTIRKLVAQTTELPLSRIQPSDKLLDDLRLNSITVAELAGKAAQELGRPPLLSPTSFANASLEQLAQALLQKPSGRGKPLAPLGLSNWVRCFTTELLPQAMNRTAITRDDESNWTVHIAQNHPLREPMQEAFAAEGMGMVVCMPPGDQGPEFSTILRIIRQLPDTGRFILVHHGISYSAFLRSIYAERPGLTICVIRIPLLPEFCKTVHREANAAEGFEEVWYEDDGCRKVPGVRLAPIAERVQLPLSKNDVVLISGGAKGIGAECALYLGRESKARLLLLGRSPLASDPEASQNALRLSAAGISFLYVECDISDAAALRAVLAEKQAAFGAVTAIVHAAGRNVPKSIASLTDSDVAATLAPKVEGIENLLAAVDQSALRLCVCFGSVLGRIGMRGNADYALANELLRARTEELRARLPHCLVLTLEWSLWSGVGMAQRLGAVETFAREGLSAISPDQGTRILGRVLSTEGLPASILISGQFARLPGLELSGAHPPLLRFLERIVQFIPGVELIAEASLSVDTDPYLLDHRMKQTMIFPAVLGIEAMAQAATALGLEAGDASAEDVYFDRPILGSESRATTIRIYAIKETDGRVLVTIRSEETDFQVDHFRGVFRSLSKQTPPAEPLRVAPNVVPAHDAQHIYGTILFQSGRFRRIHSYEGLTSTSCRARLTPNEKSWFASYMPGALVWGDPGVRDAAMHAIQACVPAHTIVPLSVKRIIRSSGVNRNDITVEARERAHCGRTFTYDIGIRAGDGTPIEQWLEVVFAQVEPIPQERFLASNLLLGPYLERRAEELSSPHGFHISLSVGPRSDALIGQAAGGHMPILRRSDRKPEIFTNGHAPYVSATHTAGIAFAVSADAPIGCDAEIVQHRAESSWAAMLGHARFQQCKYLASQKNRDLDIFATQFWCIKEASIKTGFEERGLLRLVNEFPDGWMEFESGHAHVWSWCAQSPAGQLAIALVANPETEAVHAAAAETGSLQESPL
jgi:enediyne polyketide synthase